MITMIYAAQPMTLALKASEDVSLAQVDSGDAVPRTLHAGVTPVELTTGVFMVLSKSAVGVTLGNAHIVAMTNKDGGGSDPPKPFVTMFNTAKVQEHIALAKGDDAPT